MRQWGVNNLPKVVAQQRYGRGSNPRPLDRKSDALPHSHRGLGRVGLDRVWVTKFSVLDGWDRVGSIVKNI